jgi:Domain of unknown function (DUF4136)
MNTTLPLLSLLLTLLLQACSSTNVTTDFDRQADFGKYRTFGWMVAPQNAGEMFNNSLIHKHMQSAVTNVLTTKGMRPSTGSPDLLVAYHMGVKDKIDVTSWGYGYGRWGALGGRNVDVHQYKEGTMVIDLVDASTKELVWRGIGTGAVERGNPEANISKAVADILSQYPPEK